jgi:hypothetical protein
MGLPCPKKTAGMDGAGADIGDLQAFVVESI